MSVTYIDAIHDAQKDLLTEDRDVFLYGQDIGVFGGAFKATKGLKELFPDRVIDAPISEAVSYTHLTLPTNREV